MSFLVRTIVKFLVFVSIPCLLLIIVLPFEPDGYMGAMVDKINRAESIKSPKIVIIGDSNVAYGFDSALLESHFDMPVVNFGLHDGLGQAFHTELLRKSIKRGDIVVIAPATYSDESTIVKYPFLAWLLVENDISLWDRISDADQKEMMQNVYSYIRRGVRNEVLGCLVKIKKVLNQENAVSTSYIRGAFNEYGDNDFAEYETEITLDGVLRVEQAFFPTGRLSETMRNYWNGYNEYVKSKGAFLVMSAPPILNIRLRYTEQLDGIQGDLESQITFPMISELSDYVYPIEYFYNTNLHLNRSGKAIRTNQLIKDLEKWMATNEEYQKNTQFSNQ